MTMMRPAWTAAVLAVSLALGLAPSPAVAAVLWTLTATPLAVTTGVSTTFTLVATNEDPLAALSSSSEIGCLVVNVPSNFVVEGAAISAPDAEDTWIASILGNKVTVRTTSGGDRLKLLDGIRFTVKARAVSPGSLAWIANAYRDQNCEGSASFIGVPPVVIVTGPAVTPTPSPTPVPRISPTPRPTTTATPRPTPKPTPWPTANPSSPSRPDSTAAPSTPVAVIGPGATASPDDRPMESSPPESAEAVAPRPSSSASGSPQQAGRPGVARAPDEATSYGGLGAAPISTDWFAPSRPLDAEPVRLSLGPLGLLGGIDVWAIPGLVIGVPGLLVIIFVILQGAGAMAWIPAIRRLRGEEQVA